MRLLSARADHGSGGADQQKSQPSATDIDDAMAGKICRCETYPLIRRAIHRAAGQIAEGETS